MKGVEGEESEESVEMADAFLLRSARERDVIRSAQILTSAHSPHNPPHLFPTLHILSSSMDNDSLFSIVSLLGSVHLHCPSPSLHTIFLFHYATHLFHHIRVIP